jgi:hypothetical protein
MGASVTSVREVSDTIIRGKIHYQSERCGYCDNPTTCITVIKVTLPEPMTPAKTLILFNEIPEDEKLVPIKRIGIGCGCYARAHRQITHIKDLMDKRAKGTHDPASPRHRLN